MKLWILDALDALDDDDDVDRPGPAADGAAAVPVQPAGLPDARRPRGFSEARALIAVACADGPPNAEERAVVSSLLPVGSDDVDWRVWRPSEIGAPDSLLERRRTLERMVQVALSDRRDGVVDDSERALLWSCARAWGVDVDVVEALIAEAAPRGLLPRLLNRLSYRRLRRPSSRRWSRSFLVSEAP